MSAVVAQAENDLLAASSIWEDILNRHPQVTRSDDIPFDKKK